MSASLVGQRIALTVSEPWSFGTELGVGPHMGTVVAERLSSDGADSTVVLRMDDRLVHQGSDYSFARAASRRESVGLNRLAAGERVFCSLRAVRPFDKESESTGSATAWTEDEASGLIGTLEVQA